MENHDLLSGKSNYKFHNEVDDEDEIELFNLKRTRGRTRCQNCCTGLLVFISLTLFATTIIFGIRYVSTSRRLTALEAENSHLRKQLEEKPLNDKDATEKITKLQTRIDDLEKQLKDHKKDHDTDISTGSPKSSTESQSEEEPKNENENSESDGKSQAKNYTHLNHRNSTIINLMFFSLLFLFFHHLTLQTSRVIV